MHIASDGKSGGAENFEFYLGAGLEPKDWERLERDVRRFKQVTFSEVSMRSGILRMQADFGQLSGRTLSTACEILDNRVKYLIARAKQNAEAVHFITVH